MSMPRFTRNMAKRVLRQHGIIPTPQRVEIALLLLSQCQHLSADQLRDRIRRRAAAVSKATVYNTLRLFAERGILRQVIVDPTRIFYDSNTAAHYHFYNVDDGTLTDFNSDAVQISNVPELPPGARRESIDVIVRVRNKHHGPEAEVS